MPKKENALKKKILIIDDHQVMVDGLTLRLNLESDLEVCGSAKSASEGLDATGKLKPNLVLIDLSLEDSHGLDLVKDIHIQYPDTPGIVLSMHDETVYAERCIRAGAKGYIMKDQSFDTVVEAIQTVLNGKTYMSPAVQEQFLNRMTNPDADTGKISVDQLTDRELEVFRLIGQGLRPRHIAEKLAMSPRTVDTHCKRIRLKLDVSSMTDVIDYAAKWLQENPHS